MIANALVGVNKHVLPENSAGNTVSGNSIGTDLAGAVAIPNQGSGVTVNAPNNTVGGSAPGAGNVISGNFEDGIHITPNTILPDASGNLVAGNRIGTSADGLAAIANGAFGLSIEDAPNNTVGGLTDGARNVISANFLSNVGIAGLNASGNVVEGNFIGTDSTGTVALGSVVGGAGVDIENAPNNTIGGVVAGTRNLISGNGAVGVGIFDPQSIGNVVQGNFIGTDVSGTRALPNHGGGIDLLGEVSNTTIGGSVAGAHNVISGNIGPGIHVQLTGAIDVHLNHAPANIIEGNIIGLGVSAKGVTVPGTVLGNTEDGIFLENASFTIVGGTTPLSRNTISGNGAMGIHVVGLSTRGAVGNLIEGNFIGTDAAGSLARPNSADGIQLDAFASANTIGGVASGARNVISGNTRIGIYFDTSNTDNTIEGNFIGIDASGSAALPNAYGLLVKAAGNVIGGTEPGAGNVISGNASDGILFADVDARSNEVLGNFIGTNAAGDAAVPNQGAGIHISFASLNHIGGTTPGSGNVISGNATVGVLINSSGAFDNVVQGNFIGTAFNGHTPLANGSHGVEVTGANHNTIGGTEAGAGNTIAFNRGAGVYVESGTGNAILSNSILRNFMGIDLGPLGVTPNDPGDSDTGANLLQNFPTLAVATTGGVGGNTIIVGFINTTANAKILIQFFSSFDYTSLSNAEGEDFLGSKTVTTDASGNASFTAVLPGMLPIGLVTATATDVTPEVNNLPLPTNNTSEFSRAIPLTSSVPPVAPTGTPSPGPVPMEAGGAATIADSLDTEPTADATIGLPSSNSAEGTVSPTSLPAPAANVKTPHLARHVTHRQPHGHGARRHARPSGSSLGTGKKGR